MKMNPANLLPLSAVVLALLSGGCGKSGAPRAAATPDQAMMNVAKSMQNNDPSGTWHMLPESYQRDLNEVVRAYAAAVDADLWKAGSATFGKIEEVLRTRKNLLLSSNFANMAGGRAALEQNYDVAVNILGTLKSSDLMDLQKMRAADLGRILSTTGRDLMRELAKMDVNSAQIPGMQDTMGIRNTFASLQAETISQEGDKAMVRITTPGQGPEEVAFVRVEGKWIPDEMANDWDTVIQDMRGGVAQIAQMKPAEKSQALMMLGMANGVLDQLLAAKTQQELEAVLGGVMGMMMGGGL